MLRRAINVLKYQLERLLLHGTYARLLIMAGFIGLVSIAGGMALVFLEEGQHTGSAVWWAFLRLTDPGYLGDDQGTARRVVSTALTIAGYVLFMGSLVAIMTQWLNNTIRDLERGLTPIALRGHIVVVGWTSRTAVIAREMFGSESRVRRFLDLYDARALRLVFLLEELDARIRHELRQRVGRLWRERSVAMRSGSALNVQDLMRADVAHASAILVPGEDVGPSEGAADARTVKTLLSLTQHLQDTEPEDMPLVVTELFDGEKLSIARRAYPGHLELVCTDQLIGRLLALSVLNPGLSETFDDLLAYGIGNEIHIMDSREFVGRSFAEIQAHLPQAVCLGFVQPHGRSFHTRLCPATDDVMRERDRLVVLAASHEDAEPQEEASALASSESGSAGAPNSINGRSIESVLILGWSDRVPDLILELHAHHGKSLQIDVLSAREPKLRERVLAEHEILSGVVINHVHGDVIRRPVIARQLARNYDRIVMVASDWLATGAQSDARTVLTYLLVHDELARLKRSTPLVVELMDATNRAIFNDEGVDVLVSPLIVGRVLAHIALRRELRAVYDDLFDADGPAVRLRAVSEYGLDAGEKSFSDLSQHAQACGEILLGVMDSALPDRLALNPGKASRYRLSEATMLVVLGHPG